MRQETSIRLEGVKRLDDALRELTGKQQISCQKGALRTVGNMTLREMRKLIVQDIPGARLAPGTRNRKRVSERTPLSRGGALTVWQGGNGVTIHSLTPKLLRIFVTGAKARDTEKGYNRGDHMRKNAGEGGDYITKAKRLVEPKVAKLLDDIIARNMDKKFNQIR